MFLSCLDAGLLFHQFLRFLQSTQPSTVPSTSETVVSSTSTTFRKLKSYFFVHFVCNMCICIYICFGWLEFNNKLALPNGKPQNLLYLFASHKTCGIYLQSCNMVKQFFILFYMRLKSIFKLFLLNSNKNFFLSIGRKGGGLHLLL
ncbi:uncharacterized protein LOC105846049 isoform X2 [Hydra vulgaris]|uniref:uncharacterized protein LOC105846049 isoform X2 n=1 Tax=Hydra vulgaris TaxID=6087 RepID=UPI0032EA8061